MLRSLNTLIGHSLDAVDGHIGGSSDFLFDDQDWVIRYMVADTKKWLPGRKVLIASSALLKPDWDNHRFPIELTKHQIETSPPLDEHAPVSREYEILFHKHFGYATYWDMPFLGDTFPGMSRGPSRQEPIWSEDMADDYEQAKHNHLRSVAEVMGYRIHAYDGQIGQVKDFIIDDETWKIRWLVVDTRRILPGPKVPLPPAWVESIVWGNNQVQVNLFVDQIRTSPEFDPALIISEEYERKVAEHYMRQKSGTAT